MAVNDIAIEFIEDMTRNCDAVQERVLTEILSHNAETEYLKRHHLKGATDRESFKSRIPVVSYEDIQPEICRIADGDSSPILSADPITEFLTSSGTSGGERKLMPTVKEDMERKKLIKSLVMPVINLYVPGMDKGKVLCFQSIKAESRTQGGLVAHPALTSYYKSDHFRDHVSGLQSQFTSPLEPILCLDAFQSMYTQMLSGLYERLGVLRVGAVFASGLLRAIRFLQVHYRHLCHDIATGTLSPKITDPEVIRAMTRIMRPDLDLARSIEEECSKENWEGIIKRVWPNTKYLEAIFTGTMAQYIPMLDYYSGGLPKVSMLYGSSEAYFGINLRPMVDPSEVAYTIMPNMAYFEFIPLDTPGTSPSSLVDLAKVEVGREYELAVTTYAGLYRYRVGDVLLVTGFHNSAPQFRIVRRKNVLLSIDYDKTDEAELQQAINKASTFLRLHSEASIAEYTTYADTNTIPGHYVVYLELIQPGGPARQPDDKLLSKCCLEIEESLSVVYREARVADGSVGPLEIRVVEPGTFEELMTYAVSKGTSSFDQYKVPRCVGSLPLVKLLDSRVASAHFSPSTPQWNPTSRAAAENK